MPSRKPRAAEVPAPPTIDLTTLRRLALDASVDPRTLSRVLRGERVRGLAYERAREALEKSGFQVPAPRGTE